ncbi:hypothetical protein HMPREF0762_01320 [Slackia exigua ATCC 700122]|uniref:Uncharacterized protein n=1 Tax=Slackia exigua (strain ATCC 700122 / DSM 15923 / CIP 105133 / JCM 11022 / KCTC 5966 / S-7) TaxID=649764 RepID=D0WH52_SLAES|nr:hypothetical protein HMPREF0762_01320 [Slackia exigua ATCC 700122]
MADPFKNPHHSQRFDEGIIYSPRCSPRRRILKFIVEETICHSRRLR